MKEVFANDREICIIRKTEQYCPQCKEIDYVLISCRGHICPKCLHLMGAWLTEPTLDQLIKSFCES